MKDRENFKPFNFFPPDGWPLVGYKQPADCNEIIYGEHGDFEEEIYNCHSAMMDKLAAMFPGWDVDTVGDLSGISLSKDMPDDPRADEDGTVHVTFDTGMVGRHFAVRPQNSGRVIESDYELDLARPAVEDFLMNKYQGIPLDIIVWAEDGSSVSVHGEDVDAEFSYQEDVYGNPTIINTKTKEVFTVKVY